MFSKHPQILIEFNAAFFTTTASFPFRLNVSCTLESLSQEGQVSFFKILNLAALQILIDISKVVRFQIYKDKIRAAKRYFDNLEPLIL